MGVWEQHAKKNTPTWERGGNRMEKF